LGGYGSSSIGRVAVSKTVGWGFKSLLPCQPERVDEWIADNWVGGTDDVIHPIIHQSTNPVCHWRGGRVVYRGGLENRFGLTANGGSNPSLSARTGKIKTKTKMMIERSDSEELRGS
jgi:hypothetical protein